MTATTLRPPLGARSLDLPRPVRAAVIVAGGAMTLATGIAIGKAALGVVPSYYIARDTAIAVHVASVVPAIPLGAWVLLSRKGTPTHRMLGKLWLVLMVIAATSAIFIRYINHGQFSWIHIFVPVTLLGAWRVIQTARAGNITTHRRVVAGMYLGALIVPGLFAFLPMRLMGAWLFG